MAEGEGAPHGSRSTAKPRGYRIQTRGRPASDVRSLCVLGAFGAHFGCKVCREFQNPDFLLSVAHTCPHPQTPEGAAVLFLDQRSCGSYSVL